MTYRYLAASGIFRGWLVFCAAALVSTSALLAQTAPAILVSSTALNFKAGLGQNPDLQSVFVGSSGAALTLNASATVSTGGNWLQYAFDGGVTPATLKVTPQTASLQSGTYAGQIQITAVNASNSPLTIKVTVTVGGPTPTALTAAPSALNFSAQLNGATPASQLVTVGPTDTNIGFTVTVSTGLTAAQWLQVTPVAGTTPQLLNVSVNPQGLTGGNYTATINIVPNAQGAGTVNVAVNLAINNLPTLNLSPPQGFQFYFQTGSTAIPPAQGLTVSASSGTLTMALQANTGNGLPWLAIGQSLAILGTTPIQIPISISSIVATFQPGNYSGAIQISAPGATNPSVSIPVTLQVSSLPLLTLANSPNPFSFRAGFPPPLAQSVQIGVSSGSLPFSATVQLPPGQNWLTVSPDAGTLPAAVAFSVDATGLSSGTYSGQVRIDGPGSANTPLTVPVTLSVAANGLLIVSPAQLDYNFQVGMAAPTSQSLNITTTGGNATFSVQTLTNNCGSSWLTATPAAGAAPNTVKVTVNTTGMNSPGLCTGRVGLVNQNGLQTLIPVNLTISADPLMNVTPRVLTFTGPANGLSPAVQTIQLASTDVNNPLFYSTVVSTSNGGNWLSVVNSTTGQTPGTLQIMANQGSLIAGSYSGLVEIRPTGLAPIRVMVTMIVTSNISLGVAPPSITLTTPAGISPGPQILNVSSQGGAVAFSVTAQSGQNWLSVTPASGTTPGQLVVTANTTGLSPGTYDGSLTITSTQASNPVLTVPISLVVGPAQNLGVTPLSLTFGSVTGEPAPAGQKIKLTPTAGKVDFKATVEVTGAVQWLSVAPAAGTAPFELMVAVDPTNLPPAAYSGTITITPFGLPQVVIPVSYTIAPPPLPSLSAVMNAASMLDGPIAPGEIVVLRGANTGGAGDGVVAQLNGDGSLPLAIGDTQVLFDTYFAPILTLETNQVTVVVPYDISGQASTLIQVKRKSVFSNLLQIPVQAVALGVFTKLVPATRIGLIFNEDGTPNSEKNPTPTNSSVTIYYTGDGQTNPPTVTNSVNPATGQQAVPALLLMATIGGATAPVTAYGPLPGSFAGLSTTTITVPANLGPGAQPLVLTTDIGSSQPGVFVYVKN